MKLEKSYEYKYKNKKTIQIPPLSLSIKVVAKLGQNRGSEVNKEVS
jgi:hypothetical protein